MHTISNNYSSVCVLTSEREEEKGQCKKSYRRNGEFQSGNVDKFVILFIIKREKVVQEEVARCDAYTGRMGFRATVEGLDTLDRMHSRHF